MIYFTFGTVQFETSGWFSFFGCTRKSAALLFNSVLIGNAMSVGTKVSMIMQNRKEWILVNLLDLTFLLME